MPTPTKASLLAAISPPLNSGLADQLLTEFVSLERRYVLTDWEPATLDGGQLSEAAARLLYHMDSGTLSARKPVGECLAYIENVTAGIVHNFPDRKAALHTARVIKTIYKFRSDRGAVHIDPTYTANQLDSKLVLENSRWVVSEFLRIFWTGDRAAVATAIRQIVQFDVPAVATFDGRPMVQRTDCSPEEEILILLHAAGEVGHSRSELGQFVPTSPPNVTRAISALASSKRREILKMPNGNYRLTPLGGRKVLTDLANKLIM